MAFTREDKIFVMESSCRNGNEENCDYPSYHSQPFFIERQNLSSSSLLIRLQLRHKFSKVLFSTAAPIIIFFARKKKLSFIFFFKSSFKRIRCFSFPCFATYNLVASFIDVFLRIERHHANPPYLNLLFLMTCVTFKPLFFGSFTITLELLWKNASVLGACSGKISS
jgi:hypothetical protein